MFQIASWLKSVEESARILYYEGASYFANNERLVSLLRLMSIDESYHYVVVTMAEEIVRKENLGGAAVTVDEATRNRILVPFSTTLEKLRANILRETDMNECLLVTEFSEWNDIFLFLVGSVSKGHVEMQQAAALMQNHLKTLESHFLGEPSLESYYREVRKIPKVWRRRILIVDDDPLIRDFLFSILQKKCDTVDVATNGIEAIELCKSDYHDIMIVDVEMPEMGGVEFYHEQMKNPHFDPDTMVFISGGLEIPILKERKLRFLSKPFSIRQLYEEIDQITHKALTASL